MSWKYNLVFNPLGFRWLLQMLIVHTIFNQLFCVHVHAYIPRDTFYTSSEHQLDFSSNYSLLIVKSGMDLKKAYHRWMV